MEIAIVTILMGVSGVVGLAVGAWLEARRWREKGNHEYMNRMESGGTLYLVRREYSLYD